ncbi:MAG: ferredoxin [Ilumatobacteraceae bacterium]
MIRVRVNQDECMSIGRCLADAPNVFRFDDNELSEVIPGQEGALDETTAVRIARNCPNRAIIVERADGTPVLLD